MKDNFSGYAGMYAKSRPKYPNDLFEYIMSFVIDTELAWDCGTGNGQTAIELSQYFNKVYATDISSSQIGHAGKANNIIYATEPAEKTSLENNSVNLITVSQALHWFNFDEFYNEVRRVAMPGGLIAVWTYSLLKIDPVTDEIISQHHFEKLKDYWDEERKYVDEYYKTIPFPFKQIQDPGFVIETHWDLQSLEGYLNTWSALQKFIAGNDYNPVIQVMEKIKINWPENEIRKVLFPLYLKIGYVH